MKEKLAIIFFVKSYLAFKTFMQVEHIISIDIYKLKSIQLIQFPNTTDRENSYV